MPMLLGTVARAYLYNSLVDWYEYMSHHRADTHAEKLAQVLLFHASFSNFFDDNLQMKARSIYHAFMEKLEANPAPTLLHYDYAPIIVLYKLFSDFVPDEDEPFHKLTALLSHPDSAKRDFAARHLAFYAGHQANMKNEVRGIRLLDHLRKQAYQNIEQKHAGNRQVFALLSFLPMSLDERKEELESLRDFARESQAASDEAFLNNLLEPQNPTPNPFYGYFMDCQKEILQGIIAQNFHPRQLPTGVQLDLFEHKVPMVFKYYLDEPRLQYYLPSMYTGG